MGWSIQSRVEFRTDKQWKLKENGKSTEGSYKIVGQ